MTKDDPITSALVDKFFDPVINAESDEAMRAWLRQQPKEEIERFLNFWNWTDDRDRETILQQEIGRLREAESEDRGGDRDKDPGQIPRSRDPEPIALDAKPPEILQKLAWLKQHGWNYKWYVLVAALILLSGTILINFSSVQFVPPNDKSTESGRDTARVDTGSPTPAAATDNTGPKIPADAPLGQQSTERLYNLWINQHREIIEQYGRPKRFKFVNVHEQHFKTGYVAYNVTDGWSILLYRIHKEYRKLQNPGVHLTPGSGRQVNEELFEKITYGMSDTDRKLYRSLIDRRVKSVDFKGVGIIGGIATLYIKERLYDAFREPEENEKLIRHVLHVTGDKYEVLVGLPHGLGFPSSESPRSVYFFHRDDGRYERHVVWPDT